MERFRLLVIVIVGLLVMGAASVVTAAEPPALLKARQLYNAADYDGAILAAEEARRAPQWADTASLVLARSYLERYRQRTDPTDLMAGREALESIDASALPPRESVDLLVGMGQYLYLSDAFGASAELFDSALAQGYLLNGQERLLLLDWWANALDRSAQARPSDRRPAVFHRLVAAMEEELRRDAASPVANYWLAAGARGAGDVERAWDAAVAGWVRSKLWPETAPRVRGDLDRLVVEVLIPERVRARGSREPEDLAKSMLDEWETIKQQWSVTAAPPPVDP